jgi:hypothetical protein
MKHLIVTTSRCLDMGGRLCETHKSVDVLQH